MVRKQLDQWLSLVLVSWILLHFQTWPVCLVNGDKYTNFVPNSQRFSSYVDMSVISINRQINLPKKLFLWDVCEQKLLYYSKGKEFCHDRWSATFICPSFNQRHSSRWFFVAAIINRCIFCKVFVFIDFTQFTWFVNRMYDFLIVVAVPGTVIHCGRKKCLLRSKNVSLILSIMIRKSYHLDYSIVSNRFTTILHINY